MRIVVCVKQVGGEINPFDAAALEYALCLPDAEIILLSMGPEKTVDMLLELTRLGADQAILLCDPAFAGSDTLATAYALSLAIKRLEPQLIFCGRQSVDGDTAQVGPCLATMLGMQAVTNVMEIKQLETNRLLCRTRLGEESAAIPALLTFERVKNLRLPSIRSTPGKVTRMTAAELLADPGRIGLVGSPTRVLRSFESSRGQRKCTFVPMSELKGLIRESLQKPDAFVPTEISAKKLKGVLAVGDAVGAVAAGISDDVTVLPPDSAEKLARKIREQNPAAVLWPADLRGRATAPAVQAMLNTGLCADCTHLETDGEELFMYRPASGGKITAKIVCKTRPAMATVRLREESAAFTVGFGRGAAGNLAALREMAKKNHADCAASRALVDMGLAPYEEQVGQTGRMLSSKLYLAIGISGAIQHVCGFEGAGTVIAVNPDPKAEIFRYCDYGVIDRCENCAF